MKRVALSVAVVLLVLPLAGAEAGARRARRSSRPLPALAVVAEDALFRALDRGRLSPAEYALARAQSLFQLGRVRDRFGNVARPPQRAATMILRDLVLRLSSLSGEDRELGEAILARPDGGGGNSFGSAYPAGAIVAEPLCTENICVHHVTNTAEAPSLADGNGNAIPDYVELVSQTFEDVWAKEIDQMGWRAPKSDLTSTNHGPNENLDVYIADIGDEGVYGFCTTDDPNAQRGSTYRFFDMSAFCVVDNDYSAAQFSRGGRGTTGTPALQVTAAHEFNHASHFAYDIFA
ncbi:MAG: hypothetical protein M3238_04390, partial [Actinomycetota bacterium]|nr:hypothetical protein [Actinomycetota bacterium]